MTEKDTNKVPSELNDLLCCSYCGNQAEYLRGGDNQADAIYCTECPLGVEHSGMSFEALATIWNTLTKEKEELSTQLKLCQQALQLWKKHIEISNCIDDDDDDGFLDILLTRSEAIKAMYDALDKTERN